MSDLVVTYQGLQAPPTDCSQDPPSPTKQNPTPADGCTVVLPLADPQELKGVDHYIRFDRKAGSFVLSSLNNSDDLTWVGKRGNLGQVTDMLRIIENVLRLNKIQTGVGGMELMLRISQYIVNGRVRFSDDPGYYPEIKTVDGTESQMATYLLEVVSQNNDATIQRLFGGLSGFMGDASLSKDAKDRIRWSSDILALRPSYLKFREHFSERIVLGAEFGKLEKEEDKNHVAALLHFARHAVVRNWQGKGFSYDDAYLQAFLAYSKLKPLQKTEEKGDFCERLERALKELKIALPATFNVDCLNAVKYLQVSQDVAVKQSFRDMLLTDTSVSDLQKVIAKESAQTKMDAQWLDDRGRLSAMLGVVQQNATVELPKDATSQPKLKLDATNLKLGFSLAIGKEVINRREYIISALALMRRLFDENGNPKPVRVFHRDQYIEITPSFEKGDKKDALDAMRALESELNLSRKHSEKDLPWVEGAVCLGGLAGVGVSAGTDWFGSSRDFLTPSFSAVAGGGCGALVAHYALPKVAKVRNRYLWEGVSGVGGALIGVGLYFLVKSLKGPGGDPTRFPVDEYGP